MKLSKRLQTIADFVKKGAVVADIGTDHAHIPIYLIKNNIISKAYACDINAGPLEKAKENINYYGVKNIELRLSNGLEKLKTDEADTFIIAGMGGELITDILEKGRRFFESKRKFILSPHTKIDEVRKFLLSNGFEITKEDMCIDEGKFYTVMEVKYTENKEMYSEAELLYGKYLIENKHPVLLEFLKKEEEKYISILSNIGLNEDRKKELRHRLDIIKETINEMQ
nr:class I SAM-dependent methyltransferase [uncultured Lachnoanaerobaculum sp.]